MSATTFATFVNGLYGLTYAGVVRKFDYIPNQLSTGQLPALFVRLPDGSDGPLTLSASDQGGWPTLNCELVVVIEPIAQNRPEQNYKATVSMIDTVNTTLRGVTTGQICESKLRWVTRGEEAYIGEQMYWTVVIRVTGNG